MKGKTVTRTLLQAVWQILLLALVLSSCASTQPDFLGFKAEEKPRWFQPKGRVYFDNHTDDDEEVDVFKDGAIDLQLNLLELHWNRKGLGDDFKNIMPTNWEWGPAIGLGIGTPADDSEDGTKQASGAPVVLLSAGLKLEFPRAEKASEENVNTSEKDGSGSIDKRYGIEFGYAQGWSTDEGFEDIDDGAWYVGLTLKWW